MKKRIATLVTLLALPALLVLAGTAWGQQDTTRAAPGIRARRGAHAGMMGRGFGAGGLRMAAHAGPRVLLHLKGELELSDEQVRRLEQIQEEHHSVVQAQMEQMGEHRESMREARSERDWDALERLIEDGANFRAEIARGLLNVERRSLEVLTDAQREKYDTWLEGVRIFRQQRMHNWRGMREHGMRGRGMRQRQRLHRPVPPPPPQP